MRDIANRRLRLNALRAQMSEVWTARDFDHEAAGRINAEFRKILAEGREMNTPDDEQITAFQQCFDADLQQVVKQHSRSAMGSDSDGPDSPPSSYGVAAAIVAAAREMGVDPIAIASGETCRGGPKGNYAVSRARAYAALAIRAVFPDNGNTALARWVGSSSPSSYICSIDHQLKHKLIKWWDDALFMRVIEATEAAQKRASSP